MQKTMKTSLLLIMLIIQTISLFSQSQNLILTREENDRWFKDLELSSTSGKLELIKLRMLMDTSVFITKSYPDRLILDNFPKLDSLSKIRLKGYCKPLYIISFKQNKVKYLHCDNPIQTDQLRLIANLINKSNIIDINILKDDYAKAIYGSNGNCGVIIMTTRDKKLWNNLEKIKFIND